MFPLGGLGRCKSSISNLDGFDSMKDEISFVWSSAIFIVVFSTAKEHLKMIYEAGLDSNSKGEGEDSSLKERSWIVSP